MQITEDESLIYLRSKVQEDLIASFDNTDILVWGTRQNEDVKLLGLTINIGVRRLPDSGHRAGPRTTKAMQIAHLLSQMSHSAFFAIIYPLLNNDSFKVTSPKDPLNWSKSSIVKEAEMPKLIQQFFTTDLHVAGTAKPVNKGISDWFHKWARANLPREYVRTNIDGLLLDNKGKPKILLETKRSSIALDSWQPWQDDARNYYLQHLLATKVGLNFWTLYHIKGEEVRDQTEVVLFEISDVFLDGRRNWIILRRTKTKVIDLIRKIKDEA